MTNMRARSTQFLVTAVLIGAWAPAAPGKGFSWKEYKNKPDEWFRGAEARPIIDNILSHQSPPGSWPKNLDTSKEPYRGDPSKIEGTFDNGATFDELRFLARAYRATGATRVRDAFLKGFLLVLSAQYPCGGFPQRFPNNKKGYDRYITFNDGTMVHILEFLRDVGESGEFAFVDAERRAAARRAFERGIACILACQIKVGERLTAWCAQHDPTTLEPRPARTYERVSLSGGESAGVLILLMSLDRPGPDVVRAIEAGVRWYDAVKLNDIRVEKRNGDTRVVREPGAPPLWARFYEIGTNRPFFCGRDGVKRYDLAEIEPERRNGYAWYGDWGTHVEKAYRNWKGRRLMDRTVRERPVHPITPAHPPSP
jgi:PelA/Pel-15E family pectate lyase